jgi:hypothetical protein
VTNFTIKLDVSKLVNDLDDFVMRQAPYALQLGLNDAAIDSQQAERELVASNFTLRRPKWVLDTIKIGRGDFATKEKLSVRISIGEAAATPERSKKEGLLAKFEEEGFKESRDPEMPIAVPTKALRPSFAEVVPASMFPSALRLVDRRTASGVLRHITRQGHVTRGGVVQIQGKRRTFVLDPKTMYGVSAWAVFQRFGPARGDIRMIWRYKTKVHIPARLHFYDTVTRTFNEQFPVRLAAGFEKALRTAR